MIEHQLQKIVHEQKSGKPTGIYSVCSANPWVIQAALRMGIEDDRPVLIESTCNQVNQHGGYTGLTPIEFNEAVRKEANSLGFPISRLILGGDHLGPYPFREKNTQIALAETSAMVRQFTLAGCTKIHLDASYSTADDPGGVGSALDPVLIAERSADMAVVAEESSQELRQSNPSASLPVYIIGTEVPAPGGDDEVEREVQVTKPVDVERTIQLTRVAFMQRGLEDAWNRVVAVVAQPGVEHGNRKILEYDRTKAADLTDYVRGTPFVLEGHTTDYQTAPALRKMVEDGIAILKTGQSQTAALREAAVLLEHMEKEWLGHDRKYRLSSFTDTLCRIMRENDQYWKGYYTDADTDFNLLYSLFDRQRYYWTIPAVESAIARLIDNLSSKPLPLSLISQFMPNQYQRIRLGLLDNKPEALLVDRVIDHMREYSYACGYRSLPGGWWNHEI
jgi:D-tagatose-1,6-bisphosphate aldolase subunit GatZ/KbaZ